MASLVHDFLEAAPQGSSRVLELLATAESLTDEVAWAIYDIAPIEGLSASALSTLCTMQISSCPEIASGISPQKCGTNSKLSRLLTQTLYTKPTGP